MLMNIESVLGVLDAGGGVIREITEGLGLCVVESFSGEDGIERVSVDKSCSIIKLHIMISL
jgi:hypothetical protein